MNRLGFDHVGSYVLCIAIATMVAAILISQLQRSKKAAAGLVAVAILSFLLGCIVPVALLKLSGYSVLSDNIFVIEDAAGMETGDEEDESQPPSRKARKARTESPKDAEAVDTSPESVTSEE